MCVCVCVFCAVRIFGDPAATFKDSLSELTLRSNDYVVMCFPSKKQNVNKTLTVVCWYQPPGAGTFASLRL